jgi:hypothetical protein
MDDIAKGFVALDRGSATAYLAILVAVNCLNWYWFSLMVRSQLNKGSNRRGKGGSKEA